MTGQTDVEASDARGGRAPDPRDDGKEGSRRQAGQHPDRGGLRQMRRAEPRPGGEGRHPRQIRLQAMRRQTGDAVKRWLLAFSPCGKVNSGNNLAISIGNRPSVWLVQKSKIR